MGRILLLRRQDRAHHAGGEPGPIELPRVPGPPWGADVPTQIIRDRLLPHRSRSHFLWNTLPGGLLALPDFSTHLGDFPFYYLQHGRTPHRSVLCARCLPLHLYFSPTLQALALLTSSQHSSGLPPRWAPSPSPPSGSSRLSPGPSTVRRWGGIGLGRAGVGSGWDGGW